MRIPCSSASPRIASIPAGGTRGAQLRPVLLPRARADSFEAFFNTYYSSGVPYDAETIDVDAFFFGGPAAGEVALMRAGRGGRGRRSARRAGARPLTGPRRA